MAKEKKEAPLSPDQYPTFSKMQKSAHAIVSRLPFALFSAAPHQRRDLPVVKGTTKCDYSCALLALTRARLHAFARTVCRPASNAKQISPLCLRKPTI